MKYRLTEDYTCEYGFKHMKGDIGTYKYVLDGEAIFNFEGYDEEKAKHKKDIERCGEGANIVPWFTPIPLSIIEPLV